MSTPLQPRRSNASTTLFVLAAACVAIGCGAGTEKPPESPLDAGSPPAETLKLVARGGAVTTTLGAAGGTVDLAVGQEHWALEVPPGALDREVAITLTPVEIAGLAQAAGPVKLGVRFGPSGLQFATPATLKFDGADVGALPMGVVFDDSGAQVFQVPGGEGGRYTLSIPHFSGAALFDTLPAIWIDVLRLAGALPELRLDAVAPVAGHGALSRLVCASVSNGSGKQLPRVPVQFALEGTSARAGLLRDVDERTNAAGNACVTWASVGAPSPFGELITLHAKAFPGAAFEITVSTTFLWGGEPPQVALEGVVDDEALAVGVARTACGAISFPDARPIAGYPMRLTSNTPALLPLSAEGQTDASGRFCAPFVVAESETIAEEGTPVVVSAEVRLASDRVGEALRMVRVIKGSLLQVAFVPTPPATVEPATAPFDLCVDVKLGATVVAEASVSFALAGAGALSAAVVAAPNGRACTTYTPPAAAQASPEVITASATAQGRSGTATHALEIKEGPRAVEYAGTYAYSFTYTRVDGLGRRLSGEGTGTASASFRLRRNLDGTWTALSVSGSLTQSYFELCDLTETITFTTLENLFGSETSVSMSLSGPATGVDGQRFSTAGCSLVSVASASQSVPTATLQPDGRYLFDRSLAFDDLGTFRTVSERVEIRPD